MKRIVLMVLPILFGFAGHCQYSVSGKVFDENNHPLLSATVVIENTFAGTYTNKSGEFVFKNMKKGNYTIKVLYIGYENQEKKIDLQKNESMDFNLKRNSILTDEVIVQATRVEEKTPATYSSISKEEIQKNNTGQDIPYLLSMTPSMVVSSDAGAGVGYTNINIRGTDIKRINVTINGLPLNEAESHGVWWVDLPDIASSVDNAQIQRGVGTSTNGAGAFGATINFQTFSMNREPYANVSSSYGSFNTNKNTVSVGTGLINNKFTVDARLSKISSDGYIDRAFSDLKSFYLSGAMYGKSSILKFVIFSGQEHTYQAWNGVPSVLMKNDTAGMRTLLVNELIKPTEYQTMINSDSRTCNLYSYSNQTDNYWQDHYQLMYSKEFSESIHANIAAFYTKGKGYYENYKESKKYSSYNLPNAIIGNDTITKSNFIDQKWMDNDFYGFIYSLNYRKNRLSSTLGGGWNQYIGNHFGDIIWAKIITFEGEKYRWYKGTGNKKDFNVFFKTNYLLTGNLNLYGDVQLRTINYSIGGIDDNLKDITQTHNYVFFNPKAGLSYEFNENQNIYASFGVAQREPDRSNFTDADSGKTPKPEKLFDYEIGYEFHNSKFLFRGNIFYMDYIDQLILTGQINNVGDPIMTNVKKSYREGIELEAGYKIFKKLQWHANATFSKNIIPEYTEYVDNWDTWGQDSTIQKNMTISFSPSIIANNVFQYEPIKNLHIEFISKYVGKQFIDNTSSNARSLDAYLLHNLSISYSIPNRLFKEFLINFSCNNLLNEEYETNAWVYRYKYNNQYGVLDGYFPQATRNVVIGLVLKF
jgi:iron complex outermembrane recepter protein